MTLPDPEVQRVLANEFVLGWQNIEKAEHVGLSHGYRKDQTAVGTTNGAGGRNLQIVLMAPDSTVLHVLPGFWHPEDLVVELEFARALYRLWLDEGRTHAAKVAMFTAMHRAFLHRLSPATIARSDWQSFDAAAELERVGRGEVRDTVVADASGPPKMKPVCQLLHERMAQRPFQKLADFDMESYVDYGRAFYDNNEWLDKGRSFPGAAAANLKREREQAREAARREKEARAGKKAAGSGG